MSEAFEESYKEYKRKEPGRRLKRVLKAHEVKQKELAEYLGCNARYMSLIVCGRRRLTPDIAFKVCDFLPGVRAEYLLCRDNFMTEDEYIGSVLDAMLDKEITDAFVAGWYDDTPDATMHDGEMSIEELDKQSKYVFELWMSLNEEKRRREAEEGGEEK